MDTLFAILLQASNTGDVNLLKELLEKNKLLLDKVIGGTSMGDNPLHISAMLGHADFVREVIYRKPELAKELNDQGLSPLHLAAAHGHVTVVKELLKAGVDLCLLSETQEGLLPLHIAVKKRRTVIVKELVQACEEAVHTLSNGGETILHLAVKYNSFDTVEFLVDRVYNLNAKDDRGNSILHHAVASKQPSVIKFLLSKAAIDVNIMNWKFSTPLDVLLESRPQNGDLVLGEMIRAAGGKTAAEVLSKSEPVIGDSVSSDSSNPIPITKTSLRQPYCLGPKNDIDEATSGLQKEKNKQNYDPQILLLVSTLVATVTFQAGLNPPPRGLNPTGGFNPEYMNDPKIENQLLLGNSVDIFKLFDVFALFSSVCVMMLLLCVVPRKKKFVMKLLVWVIWVATFSMGLAFTQGIYEINDYNHPSTYAYFLLYGWFLLLRLSISWVLIRFLIFLLKKNGLWEPVLQHLASLKRGFFERLQQFSNTRKINGSNCCKLLKKVIGIVLIFGVLAAISSVWVSYKYILM